MGVHTAPLFNFARISDTELADHAIIIGYFAVWTALLLARYQRRQLAAIKPS